MDSVEFSWWVAYSNIDPIGQWRGDMHAGIVAAHIHNVNRSKGSKAATAKDFMPDFAKRHRTTDPAVMETYFRMIDRMPRKRKNG